MQRVAFQQIVASLSSPSRKISYKFLYTFIDIKKAHYTGADTFQGGTELPVVAFLDAQVQYQKFLC